MFENPVEENLVPAGTAHVVLSTTCSNVQCAAKQKISIVLTVQVNGDANGHYTCATCSTKNFINIDRKMLKKLQANSLNSPQPVELMLNPDTAACPRPDLPKDKTVELRTSCQNCKKDIQRTFHLRINQSNGTSEFHYECDGCKSKNKGMLDAATTDAVCRQSGKRLSPGKLCLLCICTTGFSLFGGFCGCSDSPFL